MALAVLAAPAQVRAEDQLAPLARVGPWSSVSSLIGFRGRLWFVNSVKFRDHNSADVYSYDPQTGAVRYERHLFSQDAGRPVSAGGLLHWPYEDPRFSTGRGEYMTTDGRDWRWRALTHPRVLHMHAMHALGNSLYAATGGFHAALHRSDDGGTTWRLVYQHKNAPDSYSRMLSLATLDGRLFAGLKTDDEPGRKLFRLDGDRLVPVPGWPEGHYADELTAFRGWLYAVHGSARETRLWRTDGQRSQPVAGIDVTNLRALAAGPNALWGVTGVAGAGALWSSRDGVSWKLAQRFAADEPVDVAVYAGRVYVGALGRDGRGVLYGPPVPAPAQSDAAFPTGLLSPEPPAANSDLQSNLASLDSALANLSKFEASSGSLVRLLDPLIAMRSSPAGEALAERLDRAPRDGTVSRLAGRSVAAADKANWLLLWAIARTGQGRVPPRWLERPFQHSPHRGEKYADATAAAAWAIGELRQGDAETIEKLVARLDRGSDPPWLTGDVVGALTAVTGCRFGYDVAAWRAWLAARTDCTARDHSNADMIAIPGGEFTMGDVQGEPDEAMRLVLVRPFRLMRREVTNRDFAAFVAATGHITDAERGGRGHVWTDRWREVRGADWRHPQGPGSSIERLELHPVVQVSAADAAAYCAWRGLRLPTENEWEFAARGTDGRRYPWGDAPPRQSGTPRANFGAEKCCAADALDGYSRTAPVGRYPSGVSAFGLHDMAGNVWEWTSSRKAEGSDDAVIRGGGWGNDAYCLRVSYRHANPADIGLDMVGFRCAGD